MPSHLKKAADPEKLLQEVTKAAIGGKSIRSAAQTQLSPASAESLERALTIPIEQWRAEFSDQLRKTASKLLSRLDQAIEEDGIKPDSMAYTLAVLVDKAAAQEGRTGISNASVNTIVNIYEGGAEAKKRLIDALTGHPSTSPSSHPQTAPQPQQTPHPPFHQPIDV